MHWGDLSHVYSFPTTRACVKEWENCAPCVTWPIYHDEELWRRFRGRLRDERVLLETSHFLLQKATHIRWRINTEGTVWALTSAWSPARRHPRVHVVKALGLFHGSPRWKDCGTDKSAQPGCTFCRCSCSRPWVTFPTGKNTTCLYICGKHGYLCVVISQRS